MLAWARTYAISIHPPREGWDPLSKIQRGTAGLFQSTHPVRGGTPAAAAYVAAMTISIHPPREGWDLVDGLQRLTALNFNPPTP